MKQSPVRSFRITSLLDVEGIPSDSLDPAALGERVGLSSILRFKPGRSQGTGYTLKTLAADEQWPFRVHETITRPASGCETRTDLGTWTVVAFEKDRDGWIVSLSGDTTPVATESPEPGNGCWAVFEEHNLAGGVAVFGTEIDALRYANETRLSYPTWNVAARFVQWGEIG